MLHVPFCEGDSWFVVVFCALECYYVESEGIDTPGDVFSTLR